MRKIKCNTLQDMVIDIREGQTVPFSDDEIRAHVAGCEACRKAIPEIERRWMDINEMMMPPPDPVRTEQMWGRIVERLREDGVL